VNCPSESHSFLVSGLFQSGEVHSCSGLWRWMAWLTPEFSCKGFQ